MTKKLLVLASRFPYPALGGDKLFLTNVAQALANDYRVTLLCLCENSDEMTREVTDSPFAEIHRVFLPRWRSYANTAVAAGTKRPLQLAYYYSGEFRQKFRELASRHDGVLAHLIRTGQYLTAAQRLPSILLMADAISLNYQRISELGKSYSWKNGIYKIERRRLFEYERSVFDRFDQIWLHSDIDRTFLGIPPSPHIRTIPMGVDLNDFPYTPDVGGNTAVFIGNMNSVQNQDACFYFVEDILPIVRQNASICFRIVGNAPERIKKRFESYSHVEVTGRVDSIAAHVDNAFCGICSVRAGAGVQNKILNYFALGLPCVSSQIGLEGISAAHGKDLMVFDSASEAAEHVLALFNGPHLRTRLARNARALIESQYSWKTIYGQIKSEVDRMFESRPELASEDVEGAFDSVRAVYSSR